MSTPDKYDRRKNRDQKNVQMGEWYRQNLLPELAKSRYGSEHKQGQVVEDSLDLIAGLESEDGDVVSMIEDIHSIVSQARSTHTRAPQSESSSSEGPDDTEETELDELKRKVAEGEAIDADEHDLSVVKGVRGLDERPAIVASAVLNDSHTSLDKASIMEFCQRKLGYAKEGARGLAEQVQWELEDQLYRPIPGRDWVSKQVERDMDTGYHKATVGIASEAMSETKYRREMSGSLEKYMGVQGRFEFDTGPFASEEEAADAVVEVVRVVEHQQENGSKGYPRRSREVLREVWSRVEDADLVRAEPSKVGQSLKVTVAMAGLWDVVKGDADE
jgi:hypothetical protein